MQQTHGSLRSQGEPSVCRLSYAAYSAVDEALPPGAAEPLAPFGCMGALHPMRQSAPRISLPIQCRTGLSLLVRQSLSSLRSQGEPSVLSFELCSVLCDGRGSPSRCSRAAGSLQSQREPSIRHVKPCLVFSCKRDSPFRCSRAAAPFGRSESPSFDICHRAPLLAACAAATPQLPWSTARAHRSPCLLFICKF